MVIYIELNSEVMKKHNRVSFSDLFGIGMLAYIYVHVYMYVTVPLSVYPQNTL